MKAITRSEYGPPDILELIETPTPVPEDDEVLVKIHAAGVNMADVDYLMGRPKVARLGTGVRRPREGALGLDVSGIVQAIGKDANRFKVGDSVFGDLTNHGFGAFAEYVRAPEAAFAPKPLRLSFVEAAACPQAGVMAIQGLRGTRQIRPKDRVLINGAGGNAGPFAVQIAHAFGAEVTAVDHADKLEMLSSIGASHLVDYTTEDYTQAEARYDWILDVAAFRPLREVKRVLKPKGTYVMVPGSMPGLFRAMVVGPLTSLLGSQKMSLLKWKPFRPEDVALLTELVETGTVTPVIDRTYPLNEVAKALQCQDDGRTKGKLVITVVE